MSDIVVNRRRVQQQAIFLVQFQDLANVIQTFPWHERIGLAFDIARSSWLTAALMWSLRSELDPSQHVRKPRADNSIGL
ncbi:hypothetical protein ACVIWV_003068 [Bradyrhizobium diazoefficiens]|jgi:hypothetical protein|uniref:Uncharacterized protein n=1 Tax=Bradyrhizobium diazoefficiens TaxID=1355477 RepID=A0A0E4FZT8_9BRAD|nr:hypothetical protein [Bradyrhizobium diazoefficiens]MBP1092664.1 hypothetical protein [Bradyrhizobium japonicum]MBR0865108.1 hypothetical protein [Bradyrhizobium diazoefficiens]MBR0889642.1 hypothetical protein [Bradyrhizobium diazoefficiens]MBR0921349.1 hypothetical protein [Bradyrhizobium diazoefficiens]WLA60928.1 hypothetical protein QIH81_20380 [Bradyrhizobium diazoefficiens]